MSKASELYNIRKRNISGDQKRSEDGYNLFSTIVAPDSTAFAARLELESELAARLRYCRAFMYELGKVLTAREIAELAETGGTLQRGADKHSKQAIISVSEIL